MLRGPWETLRPRAVFGENPRCKTESEERGPQCGRASRTEPEGRWRVEAARKLRGAGGRADGSKQVKRSQHSL